MLPPSWIPGHQLPPARTCSCGRRATVCIRAWNHARDNGLAVIPEDTAAPLITEFRRAVTVGLSAVPRVRARRTAPPSTPAATCSNSAATGKTTCSGSAATPPWPTSNITERGVRPTKTQQNISGRLTSEDATQDRLDIRSYIDTARKHGHRPLDVLRRLFIGNPWQPPVTAQGLTRTPPCPNTVTQRISRITHTNRVNVYLAYLSPTARPPT